MNQSRSEYHRQYRENMTEEQLQQRRASQKQYRENKRDKDKQKEHNKNWYQKNKERLKLYTKNYQTENRDQFNKYRREKYVGEMRGGYTKSAVVRAFGTNTVLDHPELVETYKILLQTKRLIKTK
jgi:hypothetical protein